MLEFRTVELENLAIHHVGNPIQEEELTLSEKEVILPDDEVKNLLMRYFLHPFRDVSFFHFHHENDLGFNEVYHYASLIFDDRKNFFEQSQKIAKHLFYRTDHPNIKGGELYVVYLSDCKVQGEFVDAIGIFKSESKETFLKVYPDNDESFNVDTETGINVNKLDKGCLIFNMEKENGFRACVIDTTNNKSDVARYWKTDFLGVKPREDNFYHTQNYLELCKDFCEEVFNEQHQVEKSDQALLLNRSFEYFDKNKVFNIRDFEEKVIGDEGVIEAFETYKTDYFERNDLPDYGEFDIAENAVKQKKKFFKPVIKLDKRFHVYIHGGDNYVEKGYDEERQMKFYKLYFDKEE